MWILTDGPNNFDRAFINLTQSNYITCMTVKAYHEAARERLGDTDAYQKFIREAAQNNFEDDQVFVGPSLPFLGFTPLIRLRAGDDLQERIAKVQMWILAGLKDGTPCLDIRDFKRENDAPSGPF